MTNGPTLIEYTFLHSKASHFLPCILSIEFSTSMLISLLYNFLAVDDVECIITSDTH